MAKAPRRPPPDDFTEAVRAGLSIPMLCARYGVGKTKIGEWKRECGVALPAVGSRFLRGYHKDTPEEIALCLTCEREKCGGDCVKMREMKMRVCGGKG